MSKQIDQRVVSMEFDNKRFEQNVSQSMSTLDKLKAKLNLSGASKGLENVNSAAKKVDMHGLANNVETVRSRFSALEVMGVTALANITNSAVNAGKRMLAALTVEPVKDGFQEYEMTLNAVQTTMAATGKTSKEVQEELKKLDEYADKTVYSTADMLNNLPKFTNAGVALEDATKAMIGIANATALAGGDAGKASIAFYNLGQAIGTGYLTRMDYNSINNAGIATMEWKNQMVEAAIAAGTLKKVGDDLYEAGGKQFTLQQLFIDGLQKQWATTDVMMDVFGKYGDETTEIGEKSYAAAQDIKTFTMMMDSLKATAGTGWKDTWQLIFGDLEAAKELWTGLSNFISGIITKIADVRNGILKSALGRGFEDLGKKIRAILEPLRKTTDSVKEVVSGLKDYSTIVDEIIAGKWKNAPTRWQDLAAAGYDWAHAQNLVNERLGCSVRHATNYTEAKKKQSKVTTDLSKADAKLLEELIKLSDAELRAKGISESEIKILREFERTAKKLGLSVSELYMNIDKINGRWLLMEGFANIGRSISGVFKAIGKAWQEIFNPEKVSMVEKIADGLFNLLAAFHRFTRSLMVTDKETGKLNEKGKQLVRIFKGVFAVFDIILTVVGGPLKIAFKIFKQLLGAFNIDVLGFLAIVADAIVGFRDWLKGTLDFTKVFEKLVPYIKKAVDAIRDWVEATKPLEKVAAFFKKVGAAIKDWAVAFKDSDFYEKGVNIIQGLIQGIKGGAGKLWDTIVNVAKILIEKVCDVLGIASPSKVMKQIGEWFMEGFLKGIQNGASKVWNAIKNFGTTCINLIKKIDFGAVLAAATTIGMIFAANKIGNALMAFASAFEGLGDFLEDVGVGIKRLFTGIGKWFKAKALKERSQAILNFAIAIGILAASVYVLSTIDTKTLWLTIGAIGALAGIIALLSFAIGKININETAQLGKLSIVLLSLSIAMLSISKAVNNLGAMDKGQLDQGLNAIGSIGIMIATLIAATNLAGPSFDKAGKTLFKMASTILLMVFTVKLISMLDPVALIKGSLFMVLFGGFMVGLMAITKLAGPNIDGLGKTIFKMSAAILMLAVTARIIGGMDTKALVKGTIAIVIFGGIIAGLVAITKIAGNDTAKIGSTILGISVAMLLMSASVNILGRLDTETLIKGELAVIGFGAIIAALIKATTLAGKNLKGIATTLIAASIAIGILAAISVLMGLVKTEHLIKGEIAVGILGAIMIGLIQATRGANDCKGNLIVMTVAIALLVGSIVLLAQLDTEKAIVAAAAITKVMIAFALMIKYSSTLGNAKSMIGPIAIMVTVVGLLGLVIWGLSALPMEGVLEKTAALSLIMLAMSACLVVVTEVGKVGSAAYKGVLALTAMVVPLAAFTAALAFMPKIPGHVSEQLKMLLPVMAVMTALLVPLTLIGLGGWSALLGVLALTAMVVPMMAFTATLAFMPKIPGYVSEQLKTLLHAMTVMTALLVPLTLIGLLAPAAVAGIAALGILMKLMLAFGAIATVIGGFMTLMPFLQGFLDKGISVLVQLANGLGRVIGAFVGGIASGFMDSLPAIGTALTQFMTNVTGFINGAKMVDETVATGVGILVKALLALTVAELLNSITMLLNGGVSFAQLGTELSMFMMNAMPFITTARTIDPAIMTGVKTLAEAILILTGANMLENITKFLGGDSSLSTFGSQLGTLGASLKTFVTNLGTFTEDQVTTVNCAGKAIKALADAASNIPNEGGFWAAIVGDNSLATFGSKLPKLGTDLSGFITNLGTFTKDQVTTVDCAGKAIKALAEAANEIPNEGGCWAAIVGDNSLATFGSKLPKLGTDLSGFITNLGTFGEDSIATVDCAGRAIKALADAANKIPNEGGFWAKIVGDNSLATFGSKLPGLATNIAGFVSNLGTFGPGQIDTVNSACKAIKAIAQLGKIDLGDTSSGIVKLGKKLGTFADKLASFISKMNEIGSKNISSAITKTKDLIDLAQTAASANVESLSTFGKTLKSVATDGVKGFVSELSKKSYKDEAKKAAKAIVEAFIKSMESLEDDVKKKGKVVAKKAVSGLDEVDLKSKGKTAGKDLGKGLVQGIESKETAAYNAGYALGQKAVQGEKDGQKSKSPSKLTIQAGKWFGEGLVIGIERMTRAVYSSAYGLGETATNTISGAVAKISDIVNSDIDAQPTIRPVLDLTNVRAGAGSINSLFSGRTLAVDMSGVGAVSASMAGFQNGNGNKDIVSGIKALRKDIANMPRNTYNINGVTYDDGSNVSGAVGELIRAIEIERRT